ncbi:MAG: hypothetical protein QM831_36045 [Kofleriaceae bacterium]
MRDDEPTVEFVRLGDELFGDVEAVPEEVPEELPSWSPPPPIKIFVNALPLPMHSAPFERVDLELVQLPMPKKPVHVDEGPSRTVTVVTTILFLICCFSIGASIALLACR